MSWQPLLKPTGDEYFQTDKDQNAPAQNTGLSGQFRTGFFADGDACPTDQEGNCGDQ